MSLDRNKVKKIATLANLSLTEQQEEIYTTQLSSVLEYIEKLNSVNTDEVNPTFNVSGQKNVMREDNVGTCLTQEQAVSNAPRTQNGSFATKGVFGE